MDEKACAELCDTMPPKARLGVFFSAKNDVDFARLKVRVNGGVKLGHGAAQNWATLGLRGTRVMSGGQSAALSM